MIYIAENNNIGISIIGWTIECIWCSSIRNFLKFLLEGLDSRPKQFLLRLIIPVNWFRFSSFCRRKTPFDLMTISQYILYPSFL